MKKVYAEVLREPISYTNLVNYSVKIGSTVIPFHEDEKAAILYMVRYNYFN